MTARCTERGCPVRFYVGSDRACLMHRDNDTSVNLTTRADGFGVTMTAFDGDGGDGGDGDGGQAADDRRATGQAVNRHGVALR